VLPRRSQTITVWNPWQQLHFRDALFRRREGGFCTVVTSKTVLTIL
jgi:hypothetical protein